MAGSRWVVEVTADNFQEQVVEASRERPVVAYWVLLAEDGRRDGLSWLELQLAYGFSVAPTRNASRS